MPRLPPATPAGKAFAGSSIPSSSAKTDTKPEKKEEDGLPFLANTVCLICNEGVIEGSSKGRTFWMTSCGHVVCDNPEHEHKPNICTACNKPMKAIAIQQGRLQPDLQRWFADPEVELSNIDVDLRAIAKRAKSLREVMRSEVIRLQGELEIALKANEELKASLQTQAPPPEMNAVQQDYRQPTYATPQHRPIRILPAVQEEQYEDQAYVHDQDGTKSMETVLGKRQRRDFELGPPSQHQAAYEGVPVRYSQTPVYTQQPLAAPRRSSSVAGYGSANPVAGASSTPRHSFDRYRMGGPALSHTPNHLNDGRATPIRRPTTAQPQIDYRPGEMLPPASYTVRSHANYQHDQQMSAPGDGYQGYRQYNPAPPQTPVQEQYPYYEIQQPQQGMEQHDRGRERERERSGSARPQSRINLKTRAAGRMPAAF